MIKGNSHEELENFEDNSIDVLFIDGGHEYSVVKKDIEIGWNKVKPGGYICGDDYSGDYHLNNIDHIWFVFVPLSLTVSVYRVP